MIIVLFCMIMYSVAKTDKQQSPELWFFIALGWILVFMLLTGSNYSPIFGFVSAFITLIVKKSYLERKPPMF
jgi:hypothetical protein